MAETRAWGSEGAALWARSLVAERDLLEWRFGGRSVVERVLFVKTGNALLGSFDADFLHGHHHRADELVTALETEKLVLPIAFVEEDDVEIDRLDLNDITYFRQDVGLILTLFRFDEFEKAATKFVNLLE